MSQPAPNPTFNGTYEDVASFFRVTVQTVGEWRKESPPAIGAWQRGRTVVFGEQHVETFWVKHSLEARGLKPGEAAAECRLKWREHLQLRSVASEVEDLRERVLELERQAAAQEVPIHIGIVRTTNGAHGGASALPSRPTHKEAA